MNTTYEAGRPCNYSVKNPLQLAFDRRIHYAAVSLSRQNLCLGFHPYCNRGNHVLHCLGNRRWEK